VAEFVNQLSVSWAERYRGKPDAPPNDVDVLVIGGLSRADVYDVVTKADVLDVEQSSP
jgi:hypothetical protein